MHHLEFLGNKSLPSVHLCVLVDGAVLLSLVQVVHDRDDSLCDELLDVLWSGFPVLNVGVLADTKWSASEDDCTEGVGVVCRDDSVLVSLWCSSFLGCNETSTDPDGLGTKGQGGCKGLSVVHGTGSDNMDLFTGQWRLVLIADLDDLWDQDTGWNVSSVASTLASLCTDDVDSLT